MNSRRTFLKSAAMTAGAVVATATFASQALAAGARLLNPRDAEPAGPGQAYRTTTVNGVTYYWEFIASTPAAHFTSAYSYAAPTTSDSIGAGNPRTAFLVVAYNTSNTVYLVSNPDSGYSVDNVAPFAPAPFTGIFNGGGPHLHWGASTASDFASYRLYRDTAITFTPGPGNLVAALPDTGFVDMGSTWSYYKLSAVDSHGNESGFALLTPSGSFQQQTPAGSNVQVALASNVNLTFQNVTSGGTSQLSLQTGGPAPPVGLKLVPTSPKLFYELSTTATFTGTVTVCITYDPATVKQSEANLKLMHYDTALQPPTWVQVTASRDTAANQLCGTVTHFSSFALMEVDATVGVEEALTGSRPFISCAPNPISGPAQIGFDLPATTSVRLGLFDRQGRLVRELERNPRMGAGRHVVRWDGLSTRGEKLSAGVYFLRLEAERFSQSRRVVVAR